LSGDGSRTTERTTCVETAVVMESAVELLNLFELSVDSCGRAMLDSVTKQRYCLSFCVSKGVAVQEILRAVQEAVLSAAGLLA
jgi:hypothetical protein